MAATHSSLCFGCRVDVLDPPAIRYACPQCNAVFCDPCMEALRSANDRICPRCAEPMLGFRMTAPTPPPPPRRPN